MTKYNRPRNVNDLLDKLHNVSSVGQNRWIADCPVPGHKTPQKHLSIEDKGSKALVTCFPIGGHSYVDICKILGYNTLSYGKFGISEGSVVPVAYYDYHDTNGNLLYQVVRYLPKTFKVRRPDGSGGWIWGLGEVKPVLYHLDDVLKAKTSGDRIYICEGEKDADIAFITFGTTGTTNPFGAGRWRHEYSDYLQGCDVIVIPDNDLVGQSHCSQVCMSLTGKAKSLKIWRVPAPYKDLTEWVEMSDG